MEGSELDDETFFRTLQASGARALLIGRRALILLGAPVVTADYDLWLHIDDIETLNAAFASHAVFPNHTPADARARGRYVLENGERIDVMIARSKSAATGEALEFDTAWARRERVEVAPGVVATMPSISDLIITKRWAGRPKDIADLQFLQLLLDAREAHR